MRAKTCISKTRNMENQINNAEAWDGGAVVEGTMERYGVRMYVIGNRHRA